MTLEIKQVNDEFSVSAQITPADVQALAGRGVKSLICNRPDGEAADQVNVTEIEAAASDAGIELFYQPVISGKFAEEDINAFLTAYQRLAKPVQRMTIARQIPR